MPYCLTGGKYWDTGIDDTYKHDMIVTKSGLKLRCQRKFLGHHRVIIGTCDTLGNFLQMGFPPHHFTHVIIDDADQCTEPEIMVAVAQASKEHGQTRFIHIIFGENSFACSILKNVDSFPLACGFDPRLVTNLLYNYRALPSIVNAYNELLIPTIRENSSEAEMLKQLDDLLPQSPNRPKAFGIFFHGIRSEHMQGKNSPSWYNPYEAKETNEINS
ncbi:putative RNA helicase armi isoform 2-T2 [Glossina fuscipes fuscipes]